MPSGRASAAGAPGCLHIGKYYPPAPGGMENYLRDLLQALCARGVRCSALVHGRDGQAPAAAAGPVLDRAPVWFTVAFAPIAPGFPLRLRRLIRQQRPALLHLHLPNVSAFWALLLPSARRLPWVIHWHADVPRDAGDWRLRLLYRLYRPFEQRLLARAWRVLATSAPYLEASEALAPWRGKCAVVPLGIDPRDSTTIAPAVDDEHGGPLRVLAIGRLSYYKGFAVLLRAIASTPGATLELVGSGEEAGRLRALVRALNLEARVTLCGQLSDRERQARLAACDCLCLPSIERSEAFGLVLLEAMAAGRACIATAVPGTGMSWVVQHGVTGLVVPPGDPGALSRALGELGANRERCRGLGAAGRQRFVQLFHIDRSADAVLAHYRACRAAGR